MSDYLGSGDGFPSPRDNNLIISCASALLSANLCLAIIKQCWGETSTVVNFFFLITCSCTRFAISFCLQHVFLGHPNKKKKTFQELSEDTHYHIRMIFIADDTQ